MLKNILNLDGAKQLLKDDQLSINGGRNGNGPCGSTGGTVTGANEADCRGIWYPQGQTCWICN